MADQDRRTFRVRQIPAYIQHRNLPNLLQKLLSYDGTTDQIHVLSLAPSIDSYENPPTQVATVRFKKSPTTLPESRNHWVFAKEETHLPHNIIIDSHFLGLTVLNNVRENEHMVDCFAISGLASHPFGSWKARDSDIDYMWLRDSLPKQHPGIRCILYGYDTHLQQSHSFKNIEDIAMALTAQLKAAGCSSPSAKPLLFLAHSLGGIVLKQALVQMASGSDAANFLLSRIAKIILFGVPNRECLSDKSIYLERLDEQFNGISFLRGTRLISIFETLQSQVTCLSKAGEWVRDGPYEILVERESAIHLSSRKEDIHPVDKDHSNLVKFAEDDHDLGVVLHFIETSESTVSAILAASATVVPSTPIARSTTINDRGILNYIGDWATSDSTLPIDKEPYEPKEHERWEEEASSFRQSLSLQTTTARFEQIDFAHKDTFHWVFSPQGKLAQWLRNDAALFWINGKPGSGKSTVMKYICMKKHFYKEERNRQSIEAQFFFSHRGSHMEKSFDGLLHGILYQMVSQSDYLTNVLLRSSFLKIGEKWTTGALQKAFFGVVEQQDQEMDINLYLDALDEYDGNPELVAQFLTDIVGKAKALTRIKICFASRPWNVFNDHFVNIPRFCLEDYTRADMERYVDARLRQSRKAVELACSAVPSERADMYRLKTQLLRRAAGVFLWVQIVLGNLLEELTNGASPTELVNLLDALPDALETVYDITLQRINVRYRREAYIMLETILRAKSTVTLSQLWDTAQCVLFGLGKVGHHRCGERFDADAACRRIRTRSGGLLEISPLRLLPSEHSVVQPMHQTVVEFLLSPSAKMSLLEVGDDLERLNGHAFLAQYYLTLMARDPNLTDDAYEERRYKLMYHARESELSTGVSNASLWSNIGVCWNYSHSKHHYSSADPKLVFAVAADLRIYVRSAMLEAGNNFRHADELLGELMNQQQLVNRKTADTSSQHPMKSLNTDYSEMMQLLLDSGADSSKPIEAFFTVVDGLTPFQTLFIAPMPEYCEFVNAEEALIMGIDDQRCNFNFSRAASVPNVVRNKHSWVVMARILLGYPGADVNDRTMNPLHVACEALCPGMVKLLVAAGANPNQYKKYSGSPLDRVLWESQKAFCKDAADCARILVDYGGSSDHNQVSTQAQLTAYLHSLASRASLETESN